MPVKGLVRVDGKPAAGAFVLFHPEAKDIQSVPPTGTAGEDGSFTLTTGSKTGAPPGKYRVTVTWPDVSKKPTEQEVMMGATIYDGPDKLEGRYATLEVTSLQAEIKKGMSELPPLELK